LHTLCQHAGTEVARQVAQLGRSELHLLDPHLRPARPDEEIGPSELDVTAQLGMQQRPATLTWRG
jgi:hypothetical protein